MINVVNGKNGAFSIDTNAPEIIDGLFKLYKRGGRILKADVYKVLGWPVVENDYRIGWTNDGLCGIGYDVYPHGTTFIFGEPVGFFDMDDYYTTVLDCRPKIQLAVNAMYPVKVHYSGPVTTAIWPDGTKTHVRIYGDKIEEHDPEKALAMVVLKKQLGGHLFRKLFKDFGEEPKKTKSKKTGNSEPTPECAKALSDLMNHIFNANGLNSEVSDDA